MYKTENRRVGELAKNQQGNSDARANIETAMYTDGQKVRGDGGTKGSGRRQVSKIKGRVITDKEVAKNRGELK